MNKDIYNYKTTNQVNIPWGETFSMAKKAPAVANRIFTTLTDAQAYVDNINDSATEGIRITVLKDYLWVTDSEGRNYGDEGYVKTEGGPIGDYSGVYYVKSIGDGENPGELVKISRGNVAWFKGNGIEKDGTENYLKTAKVGDLYYHTKNLDIFQLIEEETKLVWKKIGNFSITSVNKSVPYYILSDNGTQHPEFSEKWVEGDDDGNNIPSNYEDFDGKSVYLWTRFYEEGETKPKYTVALVHSSLNLGTFNLN